MSVIQGIYNKNIDFGSTVLIEIRKVERGLLDHKTLSVFLLSICVSYQR